MANLVLLLVILVQFLDFYKTFVIYNYAKFFLKLYVHIILSCQHYMMYYKFIEGMHYIMLDDSKHYYLMSKKQ